MNSKILYKVFIWTFIVLYIGTAFISYCHSIEFFNIGNESWMSYILGAIFELGQATVLASLLLTNNKKTLLPWLLMILLTAVQVIGNTYSVFKFMSLSETNYYVYLSKPLLFWMEGISQDTVMIIIAWIIGAMLPIVALAMTSMVTNQMKLQSAPEENDIKQELIKDKIEEIKEEKNKIEEIITQEEKVPIIEEKEEKKESKPRVKSVENFTRY
jgi:hypothetical protein